jgi:hypothetical protein
MLTCSNSMTSIVVPNSAAIPRSVVQTSSQNEQSTLRLQWRRANECKRSETAQKIRNKAISATNGCIEPRITKLSPCKPPAYLASIFRYWLALSLLYLFLIAFCVLFLQGFDELPFVSYSSSSAMQHRILFRPCIFCTGGMTYCHRL